MSRNFPLGLWTSVAVASLSSCAYYHYLPRKTKLRAGLSFGMGVNAGAVFFNLLVASPMHLSGAGINVAAMLFVHFATRNQESGTRPAFPPMDESERLSEQKNED